MHPKNKYQAFKYFLRFLRKQVALDGGFTISWNTLTAEIKYVGPSFDYYDGPYFSFGFWWWHITLSEMETYPLLTYQELKEGLREVIGDDYVVHMLSPNPLVRATAIKLAKLAKMKEKTHL